MIRWLGLTIALVAGLALVLPARAEDEPVEAGPIELQTVALPGEAAELHFGDAPYQLRRLRARVGEDHWLRLEACDSGLCAVDMVRGPMPDRLPAGAVPGTRLVRGDMPFLEVWLADAAERSGTGVLPGPLAGAVVGRDRKGRDHRLDLPLDQGFEMDAPRLADLDGDKSDEIVLTTTREGEGAALTVLRYPDSGLAMTWQSDPAAPGVWRDCVAVADLDGDGVPEIATVTSGDGEGRLEIWSRTGARYVQDISLKGFASLVPGTRTAGIATVADMDGDGILDLVVPALDRMSLRVISFAQGEIAEPYRIALPGAVVTEIAAYAMEGRKRPVIVAGVAGGLVVLAR